MKTSGKLSQISFIIAREFRAISTSYAVLLVLMGGIFVYGLLYNYICSQYRDRRSGGSGRQLAQQP